MIYYHNRFHPERGEAVRQVRGRALIIDKDRAPVLFEVIAFAVSVKLYVCQLHESQVFLMADAAFVDYVAVNAESRGYHLMRPRG
jgi:hypothetical protein